MANRPVLATVFSVSLQERHDLIAFLETLVAPRIVPGSGLVRAAFFMSGSAFAVSAAGAAKILQSFPCHDGTFSPFKPANCTELLRKHTHLGPASSLSAELKTRPGLTALRVRLWVLALQWVSCVARRHSTGTSPPSWSAASSTPTACCQRLSGCPSKGALHSFAALSGRPGSLCGAFVRCCVLAFRL